MRTLLLSMWLTVNLLFGQRVITTVAGTDFVFPSGSLPAISAPLGPTGGVAIDKSGNVYFSDQGNQRVMKVDSNGMLTVIAGNGFNSFSGDGGPATSASIGSPLGPAVDLAGNVFVVDLDNDRVRKISTNGTITVVAGNGALGFSGDGGSAILASLSAPSGVAVDAAGNVFIADTFNNRIRKVTADEFISTVAGNGGSDSSGDGGPAIKAALSFPLGVAVDGAGNLFIADSFSNRIRKVTADGNINTVASSGSP